MRGSLKLPVLLIVLLLCACSLPVTASTQYAYINNRITPMAMFADGTSTYTLEVEVRKELVEHVALKTEDHDRSKEALDLRQHPEKGIMIEGGLHLKLYDDGTNGDRVAGDGVYTIQITPHPYTIRNPKGYYTTGPNELLIVYKGAAQDPKLGYTGPKIECLNVGNSYGFVDPKAKDNLALYRVAEHIYATDYAVFIVDHDHTLLPGFPLVEFACFDMDFIIAAAKRLYSVYPDAFDFIVVFPGGTMVDPRRPWPQGGYAENTPFFKNVRQDIRGIGLTLWDDSKTYGSAGRLQGVAYHSFGDASILLHEVGHNWGIHYGYSLGLSSDANHWASNLASHDYDVMAGYFLTGDNYYHLRHHNGQLEAILNYDQYNELRPGFSDLTLYLMGLLPPEEVEPVRLLQDIRIQDGKVSARETIITIDRLIALEGPRVPAYPEAQKEFGMAFIVIVQEMPTPAEAAFFNLMASYFGSGGKKDGDIVPFYTATGGRGTMITRLPEVSGTPVTSPPWNFTQPRQDEKEPLADVVTPPDPDSAEPVGPNRSLLIILVGAALLAGAAAFLLLRKR